MRVAAYHQGSSAVSHYRIWQPMKWLDRHGVNVRRLPDNLAQAHVPLSGRGGNIPGWESHEVVTNWADVIISNFRQGREDTARMVAQAQYKPLVVDIDDDVTCIDPDNGAFKSWMAHPERNAVCEVPEDVPDSDLKAHEEHGWAVIEHGGKRYLCRDDGTAGQDNVRDQMQAAALVTCATERLAEVYSKWAKRVEVIPNAADFEVWKRVEPIDDGLIRIGLFGSNSHLKDWRECVDAITRILREYPNTRLLFNAWLVMHEKDPFKPFYAQERHFRFADYMQPLLENPQVEIYEPCEVQDYPKWLMSKRVDIGLAPLADLPFNRAKSALKYVEFGAMGIPGVYADLEPYECVKHGVTGLKAKKPIDYYRRLKQLIEDKALRKRLGDAAYEDVKANHNAENVALKLKGILEGLVKEEHK